MIIRSIKSILYEFRKAYNKRQEGWHVLYGYDKYGRLNIYIGNKDLNIGWIIISEPHQQLGAVVKSSNFMSLFRDDEFSFGFRQVPKEISREILKNLLRKKTVDKNILNIIRRYPPIKFDEFREGPIFIGPYKYHPSIESVDDRIMSRLREEFEKKIREKYRYLG